ncbi:MAG: hypothetical protein RR058_07440 [Oscillospiraceae bacterium]
MQCPSCNIELRIGKSGTVVENGKPISIQELICPNPACQYGKTKAPIKRIRHPLDGVFFDNAEKYCCDTLIAKINDSTYFVPATVSQSRTADTLTAVCPLCKKSHSFDIGGKTPL